MQHTTINIKYQLFRGNVIKWPHTLEPYRIGKVMHTHDDMDIFEVYLTAESQEPVIALGYVNENTENK